MFLGQIQDTTFLCIFINYICRLLKYPYYLFYFFFFSFIFIFLAILFQFQIFDYSYIQSLLAFLPQFILLVSLTVKYYKQIELCLFLQTLVFVAFNKVYTKELTPYYILVSFKVFCFYYYYFCIKIVFHNYFTSGLHSPILYLVLLPPPPSPPTSAPTYEHPSFHLPLCPVAPHPSCLALSWFPT